MKTFLIDEELRDKLALVTENGIFDYCQRLRDLPETKPDWAPVFAQVLQDVLFDVADDIYIDKRTVNEIRAALSAYRGEK